MSNKILPILYNEYIEKNESIEILFSPYSGFLMLLINFLLIFLSAGIFAITFVFHIYYLIILANFLLIIFFTNNYGFLIIQPNDGVVVVLMGIYRGTIKESGFHWVNPFLSITRISLKSRNLNGEILKVNDKIGNPIQIAAALIWRVENTAKAIFDVVDYEYYVKVQYESALRNLAFKYSYDKVKENEICLRSGHDQVAEHLLKVMHERLSKAGIEVEEARITTLAFASEIAGVMLKRQQAEAIISAREKIVQGAVSIVGHAINSLYENKIVELKNQEKAELVSNLLVVLCSDTSLSPTLNTNV